jgi:cytochrome c oxidase subunit 4
MKHVASIKHYAWIAAALLALLAVTVGVAYIHLGALNTPVALLISIAKATLILLFFMHLKRGSGVIRLYAFAGFFWLGILLVLAMNDYFTRH